MTRQCGAALCSAKSGLYQRSRSRIVTDPRLRHLQVPDYGRQQIIEVVRDAAGQLPDRLHFLHLVQLIFDDLALRDLHFESFIRGS